MELPFIPQPIPSGFVILGAGGSFQIPVEGEEFLGLCVSDAEQEWTHDDESHWTGSSNSMIYAARIGSPIAILNQPAPAPAPAPATPVITQPHVPVPAGYVLLGRSREFQRNGYFQGIMLPARDNRWEQERMLEGTSPTAFYAARIGSDIAILNGHQPTPVMTPIILSEPQITGFPVGCVLIGRAAEITLSRTEVWFTAEDGRWIRSTLAFPHTPGGIVAAPIGAVIAIQNHEHVAFHQENSNGPRIVAEPPITTAPETAFRTLEEHHRTSRAFQHIPEGHVLLGYRQDITFRGNQRQIARCTYMAFHNFDATVPERPNDITEFICAPVDSPLTARYINSAIHYENLVRPDGDMHRQLLALNGITEAIAAPAGVPTSNPILASAPAWAQNHPPIPEGWALLGMGLSFNRNGHTPFNGAFLEQDRTTWSNGNTGTVGDRPHRLYIARNDQSIVAANANRDAPSTPQAELKFRDITPFLAKRAITTLNSDWAFVGFRSQLNLTSTERGNMLCTWGDMRTWEDVNTYPRSDEEFVICRRTNAEYMAKFEESIYHYEGIIRPAGRIYQELHPIMEAKKIPPLNEPSGIPLHSLSYHGTPIANIAEFMNIAEKALIEQRNLNPLTNAVMLALTQVDPEPTIDEWVDKEPVLMGGIDFHPVKHSAAIVNVEDVATSDRPISEIITRAAAGVLLRGGLSAHFQYTEAGELLVNPENPPSIEQGYEIVKRTLEIRETALKLENYSAWTLGMLADQMERLFGDDFDPSQIMAQTSRAYNTYITSLSVYRSMWNERRSGLSFTHHKEAFYAKVEPEDKEFILDLSDELKLSVADQRKLTSYIRVHGSSKFQEDRPDSAQSLLEQVETRSVNRNFIFLLTGRWYEYRGPFEHIPNGANPIINADTRATMTREGTPEKMEAWTPVGVEVPYERGHAATRTANREAALSSGEPVEPSRGGRRDRRSITHEETPEVVVMDSPVGDIGVTYIETPGAQITNAQLDEAYAQLMDAGAQILPETPVPF